MTDILELIFLSIRLVAAIALLGVIPGFTLSWWLFSETRIDLLERLFISVITSLVMSAFSAFGLVVSGLGVSPAGLVIVLTLITLIYLAGAIRTRRWQGTLQKILRNRYQRVLHRLKNELPLAVLSGLLVVLLLIGTVVQLRLAESTDTLALTEFYVSPSHLTADGVQYSTENGYLVVPVSIANREGQDIIYRIETRISKGQGSSAGVMNILVPVLYEEPFVIDQIWVTASATWTGMVSVQLPTESVDFVEIYLFYSERKQPAATLRIWIADS
jgi:uncharacterized membrane protein